MLWLFSFVGRIHPHDPENKATINWSCLLEENTIKQTSRNSFSPGRSHLVTALKCWWVPISCVRKQVWLCWPSIQDKTALTCRLCCVRRSGTRIFVALGLPFKWREFTRLWSFLIFWPPLSFTLPLFINFVYLCLLRIFEGKS